MTIWALFAMEALCMGFLHYFPWKKALRCDADRPAACVVLQIFAFSFILSFWLVDHGNLQAVAVLWLSLVVIALVRLVLWFVDDYIDARLRAREAEQREQLLRSKHGQE